MPNVAKVSPLTWRLVSAKVELAHPMQNVAKVSSANLAVSERRGWACSSYAERSQKSIPANNASAPRGQPYIIYILRRRESSLTAVFFLLFVYTSLHSFPHDSSSFHLPCKDTTSHPWNPTPLNSIEFYRISIEFYWISIETPLKSYGVELRVFEPKTPRINSHPPWTLKTNTNLTDTTNL